MQKVWLKLIIVQYTSRSVVCTQLCTPIAAAVASLSYISQKSSHSSSISIVNTVTSFSTTEHPRPSSVYHRVDHKQLEDQSIHDEDCSSSLRSLRVLHSQHGTGCSTRWCAHNTLWPAGHGRRWNTRPSKGWRNLKWKPRLSLRMLKHKLMSLQIHKSYRSVQTSNALTVSLDIVSISPP